jgi:hypothetical protein
MRKVTDKVLDNCEKVERAAARQLAKSSTKVSMSVEQRKATLDFIFGKTTAAEYASVAPIGSELAKAHKTKNCLNGVNYRHQNVTDEAERIALGLFNRKPGIDYNKRRATDGTEVKACVCCNTTYGLNNFSKNKSTKDGLQQTCKDCDAKRKKGNYFENRKMRFEDETNNVTRKCSKCGESKSIKEYTKSASGFRGSSAECKCCAREVQKSA